MFGSVLGCAGMFLFLFLKKKNRSSIYEAFRDYFQEHLTRETGLSPVQFVYFELKLRILSEFYSFSYRHHITKFSGKLILSEVINAHGNRGNVL